MMALVSRAMAFQARTGLRMSAAFEALMTEAEEEEASDRRVTEEVERRLRLREEAAATLAEAEASLATARAAMVAGRDARAAARSARSAARVLTPEQSAVRQARMARAGSLEELLHLATAEQVEVVTPEEDARLDICAALLGKSVAELRPGTVAHWRALQS